LVYLWSGQVLPGWRPQAQLDRSGVVFRGLAVARETSNVCVHPEKERERAR
jgi:hypothetical protein